MVWEVESRPNSVEKGFKIKVLPDICGFGGSIWRKVIGELAFLRQACYYNTSNMVSPILGAAQMGIHVHNKE